MNYQEYEAILTEVLKLAKTGNVNIPDKVVNNTVDALASAYARAYKKLYVNLVSELSDKMGVGASPSNQDVAQLITMIESELKSMNEELLKEVQAEIQKNYFTGDALQIAISNEIKELGQLMQHIPYMNINNLYAEVLAKDTMEDLLFATTNTERNIKKVVREIFQKHLSIAGLDGSSQKEIISNIKKEFTKKAIQEKLAKEGFVGIIDKAGRKWNLKTYIEMVVKTKALQSYHEGIQQGALQGGKDLAMISRRGASDSCRYFEGLIISMSGQTEGFLTYAQCRSTGLIFHPNCKHTCYPVRSLEALPEEDVEYHLNKAQELKSVLRNLSKKKKSNKK